MVSLRLSAAALVAVWLTFCGTLLVSSVAAENAAIIDNSGSDLVAEMRRSFTLHGKTIPPEIFRDFGDGDLADSGSIWVTVDVAAAIDSNLYFDPIREVGNWKSQTRAQRTSDAPEETAYGFYGSTENGLLVVLTSFSGGGTGIFYTLHILDVATAWGFDLEGKRYQRIDLTDIRRIILGDRWEGEVKISGNTVRVATTRSGPADDSARAPFTIIAERP